MANSQHLLWRVYEGKREKKDMLIFCLQSGLLTKFISCYSVEIFVTLNRDNDVFIGVN